MQHTERRALALFGVGTGLILWRASRRAPRLAASRRSSSSPPPPLLADLPSLEVELQFNAGTHDAQLHDAPVGQTVRVYDGRPQPRRFTLDGCGFQLVEAPAYDHAGLDLYEQPEEVVARLYPQVEALLLKHMPGARRVLLFDHLLRNPKRMAAELEEAAAARGKEDPSGKTILQPRTRFLEMPLGHIHGDYTVRSGVTRARQLLAPYATAAQIDAALSSRFAIVNVWHSCGAQPVAADPLALCVWGSFSPRDVRTKRLTFPHRVGETYQALHSPSQQWVHFSSARRDEAILLKTFDSATDGRARFALHGAFRTPQQAAGAALPTRESIELRALVLFADGAEAIAPRFINPSMAAADAPPLAREQARLTELELYNLIESALLPASDEW